MLVIRVLFAEIKITKTIQFHYHDLIQNAVQEAVEKYQPGINSEKYGFFMVSRNLWLNPRRTFAEENISSGDYFEFRNFNLELRVGFVDGSMRHVLVNGTLPLKDVVREVCENLNVSHPEEFSFYQKREELAFKERRKKDNIAFTESDQHWYNPDMFLPQQGLGRGSTVILKKKFFVSDALVTTQDPVHLTMLYIQSRDMIITGKVICSFKEAVQLGALQLQVFAGNHKADEHIRGFIKLHEYTPPEYHSSKAMEKQIFMEHKNFLNVSALDAMLQYVTLCRSLNFYGTAFFLVQETNQKKKLVSVLLGISSSSLLRVDAKTQEILQRHNFKAILGYRASPKNFSVNLGDNKGIYTVQTLEGNEIARLLAGYAELVKKSNDKTKERPHKETQGYVQSHHLINGHAETIQKMGAKNPALDKNAGAKKVLTTNDENFTHVKISSCKAAIVLSIESHLSNLAALLILVAIESEDPGDSVLLALLKNVSSDLKILIKHIKIIADLHKDNIMDSTNSLISLSKNYSSVTAVYLEKMAQILQMQIGIEDTTQSINQLAECCVNILSVVGVSNVQEKVQLKIEQCIAIIEEKSNGVIETVMQFAKVIKDPQIRSAILTDCKNARNRLNLLSACMHLWIPCFSSPLCFQHVRTCCEAFQDSVGVLMTIRHLSAGSDILVHLQEDISFIDGKIKDLISFHDPNNSASAHNPLGYKYVSIIRSLNDFQKFEQNPESVLDLLNELTTSLSQFTSVLKYQAGSSDDFGVRDRLNTQIVKLSDATETLFASAKSIIQNQEHGDNVDFTLELESIRQLVHRIMGKDAHEIVCNYIAFWLKNLISTSNQIITNLRPAQLTSDRMDVTNFHIMSREMFDICAIALERVQRFSLGPWNNVDSQSDILESAQQIAAKGASFVQSLQVSYEHPIDDNIKSLASAYLEGLFYLQGYISWYSELIHDKEFELVVSGLTKIWSDFCAGSTKMSRISAEDTQLAVIIAIKHTQDSLSVFKSDFECNEQSLIRGVKEVFKQVKVLFRTLKELKMEIGPNQNNTIILENASSAAFFGILNFCNQVKVSVDFGKLNDEAKLHFDQTDAAFKKIIEVLPTQDDINRTIKRLAQITGKVQSGTTALSSVIPQVDIQEFLQIDVLNFDNAATALLQSDQQDWQLFCKHLVSFEKSYQDVIDLSVAFAMQNSGNQSESKVRDMIEMLSKACERFIESFKLSYQGESDSTELCAQVKKTIQELLSCCLLLRSNASDLEVCNSAIENIAFSLELLDKHEISSSSNYSSFSEAWSATLKSSEQLRKHTNSMTNILNMNGMDLDKGLLSRELLDASKLTQTFLREALFCFTAAVENDLDSAPFQASKIDYKAWNNLYEEVISLTSRMNSAGMTEYEILEVATKLTEVCHVICSECQAASNLQDISKEKQEDFLIHSKFVAAIMAELIKSLKLSIVEGSEESKNGLALTATKLLDCVKNTINLASSEEFKAQSAMLSVGMENHRHTIYEALRHFVRVSRHFAESLKDHVSNQDILVDDLISLPFKSLNNAHQKVLEALGALMPGQSQIKAAIDTLVRSKSMYEEIGFLEENRPPKLPDTDIEIVIAFIGKGLDLAELFLKSVSTKEDGYSQILPDLVMSWKKIPGVSLSAIKKKQLELEGALRDIFDALCSFLNSSKKLALETHSSKHSEECTRSMQRLQSMADVFISNLREEHERIAEFKLAKNSILQSLDNAKKMELNSSTLNGNSASAVKKIEDSAKDLIDAVAGIISHSKQPQQLLDGAKSVSSKYLTLLDDSVICCRIVKEEEHATNMITDASKIGLNAIAVIDALQELYQSTESSRSTLIQSARSISGSVTAFINYSRKGSKTLSTASNMTAAINDLVAELEAFTVLTEVANSDLPSPLGKSTHKSIQSCQEYLMGNLDKLALTADSLGNIQSQMQANIPDIMIHCQLQLGEHVAYSKKIVLLSGTFAGSSDQLDFLFKSKCLVEGMQSIVITSVNACSSNFSEYSMQRLHEERKKIDEVLVPEMKTAIATLTNRQDRIVKAIDHLAEDLEITLTSLELDDPEVQSNHITLDDVNQIMEFSESGMKEVVNSRHDIELHFSCCRSLKAKIVELVTSINGLSLSFDNEYRNIIVERIRQVGEHGISIIKFSHRPEFDSMGSLKFLLDELNSIKRLLSDRIKQSIANPDKVVVAELLEVATSIEDAVMGLPQLGVMHESKENDRVKNHDPIISGAKAIGNATSSLIRAATQVQKEIAASGKVTTLEKAKMYFQDGGFHEGLISAAKAVAISTKDLCQCATQVSKGVSEIERVITYAKDVAASTTRLLTAASVRADPHSKHLSLLKATAKAVSQASEQMAGVASSMIDQAELRKSTSPLSYDMQVQSRVAEMEAQTTILRIEKDLEQARSKLLGVRKSKYSGSSSPPRSRSPVA